MPTLTETAATDREEKLYPLFAAAISFKALEAGYKETQKGKKKYTVPSLRFDLCATYNLVTLWRKLKKMTYRPGVYFPKQLYRPKRRSINAPQLPDKIVQNAMHKVLWGVYEPVFIKDSFACMKDRGEHKAADRLQHFMRVCQQLHGTGWILKMDSKDYFASIDRDILKRLLRKKIKDEKFLWLCDVTIDSSPEGATGLPFGCVTSQDFGNICF